MRETIGANAGPSRPGVTRLSASTSSNGERRAAAGGHRPLAGLARLSLFVGTMTSVAGCFDTPPDYSEPVPIPPVIISKQVKPPLTSLYVSVSQGSTSSITFDVPFRADDFGVKLQALFIRDIASDANREPIAEPDVPADPRPFADQMGRSVSATWSWNKDGQGRLVGCHTMTAIISDTDNIHFLDTDKPDKEARVTWFLSLQQGDETPDQIPSISCFQSPGAAQ
jgi:hypothetical protein